MLFINYNKDPDFTQNPGILQFFNSVVSAKKRKY